MKYKMFLLLWLFVAACRPNEESNNFALPKKGKSELISMGYKNVKFQTSQGIKTLDGMFYKTIKDTTITYVFFQAIPQAIEIDMDIKNNDTIALFDAFIKRGFTKVPPIDTSAKAAFIEPSKQIHYDVHIVKSRAIFTHNFVIPDMPPPTKDISDTSTPLIHIRN